jgi:hypothetical protein
LSFRAKRGIWVLAGGEKSRDPRFTRDDTGEGRLEDGICLSVRGAGLEAHRI